MGQDMVPETVTYKCSYCEGPVTSTLDRYRFTDICPHCRGSVLIPRPANEAAKTRASLDELNAATSGEWPLANFGQRPAAAPQATQPSALTPPSAGIAFSDPDKVELPDALNEHAQHVGRVPPTSSAHITIEPATPHQPKLADTVSEEKTGLIHVEPTRGSGMFAASEKPAPASRTPDTKHISAFTTENFKRGIETAIVPKPDTADAPVDAVNPVETPTSIEQIAEKIVEPIKAAETVITPAVTAIMPAVEIPPLIVLETRSEIIADSNAEIRAIIHPEEKPAAAIAAPPVPDAAPIVVPTDAASASDVRPTFTPPSKTLAEKLSALRTPSSPAFSIPATIAGIASAADTPTMMSMPLPPTLLAVDASALHASKESAMREGVDPNAPPLPLTPDASTLHLMQPPTKLIAVAPPAYESAPPTYRVPHVEQFPEQPPARKSRAWLVAATLLIAACAGFFIYKTVTDGQKRVAIETNVDNKIRAAGVALQESKDIDIAVQQVNGAKALLANPEVPLTPDKVTEWNKLIASVESLDARSKELDAKFAQAETAPDKLKSELLTIQLAERKNQSVENIAYLAKIDKLLEGVEKVRVLKKSEVLEAEMLAAAKLYKEGKFKDAAERARLVENEIPRDPIVANPELKARAETFIKRNDHFERARRLRLAANEKTFGDTLKKLQAEIDQLDPKNEEYKPLIDGIAALKNEVASAEAAVAKAREEKERLDKIELAKSARKLNPKDLEMLTRVLGLIQTMDPKLKPGSPDVDAVKFTYEGKPYRFGIERAKSASLLSKPNPKDDKLFIQCGDNLVIVDIRHFMPQEKGAPASRPIRAVRHAIALGEALKAAGVSADSYWETKEEAPLVSGRRFDGKGNEFIFLGDRLYTGKASEKLGQQKKVDEEFKRKAEALAVAVEADEPTKKEVRDIVAMAVRAAATEADWYDHLPGEFVRHVLADGYVEKNMPGSAERLKKQLADFRDGFKMISQPFINFEGTNPDGNADEFRTYEDHAIWQIFDKKTDTTTFAIKNPDDEKDCLFILYDYPGKLSAFPEDKMPDRVRMTHQAVGVTAEYVPATGKMTWDPAKWELAASLEQPVLPEDFRKEKGYGLPSWSLPPHVLLVDKLGHTKGIVTPFGRLDSQDFSKIADEAQRKKAMDGFIDQMVKVLPDRPEGSYLHLYYRYMFQYTLDSPVTSHTNLLGSRTHCGDIHQTTTQSLERFMGGRYVGDCDDLAEFFVSVTRKMGKLSYVMSLPAHAACGWADKAANESEYTFNILDTGPPRKFKTRELDKAVEMANRAYDSEGTMRFDPKSLGYLFRFDGEPTRTPYYLSSRMYIDAPYGEAMEKVQSYWHFHFYALGIQTMLDMIEKNGDRVAENCNEVAGLYGQVREVEQSIRWSKESIKQMKSEEKLSRMGEEFRIANMWRGEKENDKAFEAIKGTVDELNKLHSSPDSFNYLGMRMQVMGLLVTLDRPFEAWEMIRPNIEVIGGYDIATGKWQRIQGLKLEHMASLTTSYLKMQDLIRNRKVLNPAESKQMLSLKKVLDAFYSNGRALFEEEDDFNEYMRKYAFVGIYYASKEGRKKYLEELLKDGPYPEPGKKRNHFNRVNAMEEDWNWIRLSISSYSIAIADAIDLEDPPEKWRIDEAVKLCDQMAKAGVVASKFGSLGHAEFSLLSTRCFRAFLVKDWKDLEEVLKETSRRDWARLTTDISETFGRGARFCTPEEFAAQYRVFTKYIKTKPSFFTVVYEAYRADGFKHALEAAKIACELNPDNADMKRELGYLEGLVAGRLKKAAEKTPAKEPAKETAKEPAAK